MTSFIYEYGVQKEITCPRSLCHLFFKIHKSTKKTFTFLVKRKLYIYSTIKPYIVQQAIGASIVFSKYSVVVKALQGSEHIWMHFKISNFSFDM